MLSTMYPSAAPSRLLRRRNGLYRALAAAWLAGGFAGLPVNAAIVEVTSPDDTDSGAIGTCTLRQAIMSMDVGGLVAACHNSGAGFGVDDTITFAESAITGAATPGTVTLADSPDTGGGIGGTLVVFDPHLTIDGSAWLGVGANQYSGGVTIARPADAVNAFGILRDTVAPGGSLELRGITIRNGAAGKQGGGIDIPNADLRLTDSTISGNRAGSGGGIHAGSGAVWLTRSTLDRNWAYLGGGIQADGLLTVTASTITGNDAMQRGGGIYSGGGTQTIVDSTIDGNSALYDGGGINSYAGTTRITGSTISNNNARYTGGGIRCDALTMTNSTIAGNHVLQKGGGLYATGAIALSHVTVSANGAHDSGGGIDGSGNGTIDRSIVAGNSQDSGDDIHLGGAWTASLTLTSAANLDIGPLQDNGGPTTTMLPGIGSVAIDAIELPSCVETTDQRGVVRPQGTGCDIGAVEVVSDILFGDGFDGSQAARRASVPGD